MFCALAGLAFLVGLYLIVKGDFQFQNRVVPGNRGRLIGLVLMVPLIANICHAGFVGLRAFETLDVEALMDAPDQATMMRAMEAAMVPFYTELLLVQLGSLVLAAVVAFYLLFNVPATAVAPRSVATPMSQVMTPQEAAAYLRVSEQDVRALIEEGRLAAARIGGDYRIAKRAVDDFLLDEARRADDVFGD